MKLSHAREREKKGIEREPKGEREREEAEERGVERERGEAEERGVETIPL